MRLFPNRARYSEFEAGNIGPPPLKPLIEDAVVYGNGPLQDVRRDRQFKFVGMRRSDEDKVAPEFSFRRLTGEVTRTHRHSLPRSYTEQGASGPRLSDSRKYVISINPDLRAAVSFGRRFEELNKRNWLAGAIDPTNARETEAA